MRDWEALVQERLAGLALEPQERAAVIAGVAAHLEDICEEMLRLGLTEEVAVRRALSRVGDWRSLQRQILAEKRKGHLMEKRIRQLWIPGFLMLIFSMLLLTVFLKLGLQPRIVWSGPGVVLLYTPWLLSLPVLGALGAYVSSRAGGSQRTVLLASVFPALALSFAFLVMSPIGLAIEAITGSSNDFGIVAASLLKDGIGWILVPGAALLLGGLLAHLLLSSRSSSRHTALA
jgi:hypothetical protein